MDKHESGKTPSRIAALETSYKSLHEDVGKLADVVAQTARETRRGFEDLNAKLSSTGKTDWQIVFAGIAVLLTIIYMGSSGFIRDLHRIDAGLSATPTKAEMEALKELLDVQIDRSEQDVQRITGRLRELEKNEN